MKFEYIQKHDDNRVVVYAPEKTKVIEEIENLAISEDINILGYDEDEVFPININDILSFYVENDKTYAILMDKTYSIKFRLYQIEEKLTNDFIRINKSRIINRKYIEKFDLSWSGTLLVVMKNGLKDYVSRRLISSVKERMNLK